MGILFIIHWLAVLLAGIFAGTCLYVAAVGHPTRLKQGRPFALTHFRASLVRSEKMQPALHGSSLLCTIITVIGAPSWSVIAALVSLAPILPLSLIVIVPVNRALEAQSLLPDSEEAMTTLRRWGPLHATRAAFAVLGFAFLAMPTT